MSGHKVVYTKSRFPKSVGKGLCKGCHEPITDPRRSSWCKDECKKRYDPHWVKKAVVARDKHICQLCGTDIHAAHLAWRRARPTGGFNFEEWRAWWRAWWRAEPKEECDHIVPFSEGGHTVVENMRTLCKECHLARTAEWRKTKRETKSCLEGTPD